MTPEVDNEVVCPITLLIKRTVSSLIMRQIEPIGKWFHYYEKCSSGQAFPTEESLIDENSFNNMKIDEDITYLRCLDPADWKNQDHYHVLGLQKYRYNASDDDIKKAYRIMVLQHHPDKRSGNGKEVYKDDDYFTCITKAYEILGVPSKRKSYDSVDPEFDDSIPSLNSIKKDKFFEMFSPVFERNSRWSTIKQVPLLGELDDSKDKVNQFYTFWYSFDSWREFSYLDEEEKEKGQDREERRWIEKQNKAERSCRKKEEMARIRKLVDCAYNSDPRIEKFKEEEKQRKLAIKLARQEAVRRKNEEEERIKMERESEERQRKEALDAELKAKLSLERKEREAVKKIIKLERKKLRTLCKNNFYYVDDDKERVEIMTDVELLCEALTSAQLNILNEKLNVTDMENGKLLLLEEVSQVKNRIEKERKDIQASLNRGSVVENGESSHAKTWQSDDIQLLIKAVNLFPAGTSKRWEVVAEYVNFHSSKNCHRKAKDILQQVKELQKSNYHVHDVANTFAFQNIDKDSNNFPILSDSEISLRVETPQETSGATWSADEQRLLEQALKTYPATTEDRWDLIADCISGKSKKDCMKRYRELVEMVRAKKAAQTALAAKK